MSDKGGVICINTNSGSFEMDNVSLKNDNVLKVNGDGGLVYCGGSAITSVIVNNVNFTNTEGTRNTRSGGGMYLGTVTGAVYLLM